MLQVNDPFRRISVSIGTSAREREREREIQRETERDRDISHFCLYRDISQRERERERERDYCDRRKYQNNYRQTHLLQAQQTLATLMFKQPSPTPTANTVGPSCHTFIQISRASLVVEGSTIDGTDRPSENKAILTEVREFYYIYLRGKTEY